MHFYEQSKGYETFENKRDLMYNFRACVQFRSQICILVTLVKYAKYFNSCSKNKYTDDVQIQKLLLNKLFH